MNFEPKTADVPGSNVDLLERIRSLSHVPETNGDFPLESIEFTDEMLQFIGDDVGGALALDKDLNKNYVLDFIDFQIRIRVSRHEGYTHFHLDGPQGGVIAHFILNQDFELQHRLVTSGNEGKGLATKMLALIEGSVQSCVDRTGKFQKVWLPVGQPHVLSFFLRNGYTMDEEDTLKFEEVLSDLESGNLESRYVLKSAPRELSDSASAPKKGYVFTRAIVDRLGEDVFRGNNHMRFSETFMLQKMIAPQGGRAEDLEEYTRDLVGGAVI